MTEYKRKMINDEIIAQAKNGLNYAEIGRLLGYSREHVRQVVKRWKVNEQCKKNKKT